VTAANKAIFGCSDICVNFGGVIALNGVSLHFDAGRVYGIIGPNGAGKTTLVNVLSGRLTPASGTIELEGRDITAVPVHERARIGVARSFQVTQIFPGLSVRENLEIAQQAIDFRLQPFWKPASSCRSLSAAAERSLCASGLIGKADFLADQLSHGDQRALDLALAVLGEPKVLLLDEPLAGVGHQDITAAARRIKASVSGRTVILVEHNMGIIMEMSDVVVVMKEGQVIAIGTPEEIRKDKLVRAAYLGERSARSQ
jgi:branched-chain amino acid transport system ATP-binding protein